MKQIFDCINAELVLKRAKYVSDEIRDRENGLDLSADRTQLRRFGVEDAIRIVAEAEAKWEADCCIRVVGKPFTSSCGQKYDKWTYVGEPYCAKCGKPIKISEVE